MSHNIFVLSVQKLVTGKSQITPVGQKFGCCKNVFLEYTKFKIKHKPLLNHFVCEHDEIH